MADKLREKIARCLYETHHGQTIGVPEWASIWLPAPVAEDWRRKVDAMQDQRKYTPEAIMDIVAKNIEYGNQHAISELLNASGGAA